MGIWEALALARRILAKPWVQSALGFLAKLFKAEPKPGEKVFRRDDPDRPRDATEDLKSENQPNV